MWVKLICFDSIWRGVVGLVWFVSIKPLVSLFNRRQNARAGDGAMVLDARA